jgi:ubiquinone/menaquinone biosynthesis C-methylase UbiE
MSETSPTAQPWCQGILDEDQVSVREAVNGKVPYLEVTRLPDDVASLTDESFHDDEAPIYDAYCDIPRIKISESWVLDWIGQHTPKGVVVDLGSGTGRVAAVLASPTRRVMAVDRSQGMLELARCRIPEADGLVLRADIRELPFHDSTVDAVVCSGVLHHLPEWTEAISEAARVLKPGGKLIVREPSAAYPGWMFAPLERLMEKAVRRLRPASALSSPPDKQEGLSPTESPLLPGQIVEAGKAAGLRVEHTASAMFFGSLGIPDGIPWQGLYFWPANFLDRVVLRVTRHRRGALLLCVLTREGC